MRDVEVPRWLQELPLAPTFRPTDTEFEDPIAYISKIEKEASAFGICKVVPPLPKPSRQYVLHNLNKSLLNFLKFHAHPPDPDREPGFVTQCSEDVGNAQAVFTTRHQQLGYCGKKTRGSDESQTPSFQMQVWESGEFYTLGRFESKSKMLARDILGLIKDVSPLTLESIFWESASDDPIYVEYANDVPGSGFEEPKGRHRLGKYFGSVKMDSSKYTSDHSKDETSSSPSHSSTGLPGIEGYLASDRKLLDDSDSMVGTSGWKLSNSPWNLQIISKSSGSLTRFMPDDIPGVTSPMIYIGMLFSWFAWHVEDHELHSLNFLHTGAPKTWYAVPGEYAFAFEQLIHAQAYGSKSDHLAVLALLGKKTTLLSPEAIIGSGIPCCRLVQYPGEFIVTFPRAYHVGFSHGFNCGEAANFATPEWLKFAKGAAVRRAAMDYLPMLSHQQLLYELIERGRGGRRRERELSLKTAFVEDTIAQNNLASLLLLRNESAYRAVTWDSGTLPCVTCGLLGFPFMCILQPAPRKSSSPRIFCIDHALQAESLLSTTAAFLVICHADWPRMRALAVAVAEDVGRRMEVTHIPVASASCQDTDLIRRSIHQETCAGDWTVQLGLNLRHCVLARRTSPPSSAMLALALPGLWPPPLPLPQLRWRSRRCRTPTQRPKTIRYFRRRRRTTQPPPHSSSAFVRSPCEGLRPRHH